MREQAKLTQREVAHQLGISLPSYVKWERREIGLTRDRLQQLAAILGGRSGRLFSTHDRPKRNGPVGRARKSFETISSLPRNRQKQILDVIDVLVPKQMAPID
ncbi:MAG: helix-turn-helix domain-containing protein [Chthoniobacterales bacterium]